ncbi:MAG: beta-lactamase hydrolase domain-containing protein [Nostoc sp. CmiVER01]|uniref:beta-lactamase hydrolase domain-containing protein n=1 Tax=Nostoc sp. CmiVER01 TaxID=3075384 RepID=UPI002AD35B1A|nr:sulfur transferase domain-containing protein [Nostoc sp. CmiVER01]MDZ8126333.1 sulfur transferase domain-containing protein [Nostoc sp. CmiVER01]
MSDVKKVSDEFSADGQPTPETLKQLAAQGYKSVVNLRWLDETGALEDEQQHAQAVGLEYVNVPLKPNSANDNLTATVLSELQELPTPVYFHCGAGGRASALALIAFATQQKLNREQVLARAKELDINPDQPHLKQYLESLS